MNIVEITKAVPATESKEILQKQFGNTPIVSIIVPVYNVEEFLPCCLDSIVNQTFPDIEIICINDGSTDRSLEILEKYAQKDCRIKIINKKNEGQSSARNVGLDVAKGVYVCFVDSDDWIDTTTIEKCVAKMAEGIDLVCYGAKLVNNGVEDSGILSSVQYHKIKITGQKDICEDVLLNSTYTVWNKFYKRCIINEFRIRFVEDRLFEDDGFSIIYMMHCRSAYYLDEYLYYYVRHRNSIMDKVLSRRSNRTADNLYIFDAIYQHCIDYELANRFKKVLLSRYITHLRSAYRFAPDQKKEMIRNCASDLAQKYDTNYINTPVLTYVKKRQYAKVRELNDVIVSLSSSPHLIDTVHLVIETLFNQTMGADKVILWLDPAQFPNKENDLPESLLSLKEKGLIIDWHHNIKAKQKLIPALCKYPNAIIVTADDNVMYDKEWLRSLYRQYINNEKHILCHSMTRLFTYRGRFRPLGRNLYFEADGHYFDSLRYSTPFNKLKSDVGVLYPPHSLHPDVLDEELMMRLSPFDEDTWVWIQGVRNGYTLKFVENIKLTSGLPETQKETPNTRDDKANEMLSLEHLNNIIKHYPEIREIFDKETERNTYLIDSVLLQEYAKRLSAHQQNTKEKIEKLQEDNKKAAETNAKIHNEVRDIITKLQEENVKAAKENARIYNEARDKITELQEENIRATEGNARIHSEIKDKIARLRGESIKAAEENARIHNEAKDKIAKLQEEKKRLVEAQAQLSTNLQKLQEAYIKQCEKNASNQIKYQEEILKLRKEQRENKIAAATMLREVALLPLTWLNLQRCRMIQHFTFGKKREHYKKKKWHLRTRVKCVHHFLKTK